MLFTPRIRGHLSTQDMTMNTNEAVELEIAELEYDVAGAGSIESGDSQVNHAAWIIINVAGKVS